MGSEVTKNRWLIASLALLGLIGLAIGCALIWWLVWSIVDLSAGNPVSVWNILGIVIPGLFILSGLLGKK